jgi:hypothetical protein
MNVDQLHAKYGTVLAAEPFLSCASPRQLWNKFQETYPRIAIKEHPFKTWLQRHRLPTGATYVSSAAELDENHGDTIRHLAAEYPRGFTFRTQLTKIGIHVSDAIATRWLTTYGGQSDMKLIDSCGHLELHVGQRIRESAEAKGKDANSLRIYLNKEHKINVAARHLY